MRTSTRLNFLLIICTSILICTNAFAIYDKIAIDITPKENEIQFCFDFDTKSFSKENPSQQLDKSYLVAVTQTPDILFVSNGSQGLEISSLQQGVEPPVFLSWTPETDSFCLPFFNRDALSGIDLYCAVGSSFTEAIEQNRFIRFFHGVSNPQLPQPAREWTVMVYMIGSNLEPKGIRPKNGSNDIVEMINGTASAGSEKVNVVLANGGSYRYGWDSMKKSLLYQGQQYLLDENQTVNMLDPATLESFVLWGANNFPADHYALILWDHGGGTMGFGLDPEGNPKGETISLPELKQVYTNIKNTLGKNLDAVVYDACLMASIEVVEITSIAADAMSASAENIPSHGIDYTNLISNLASGNIDKGVQFAKLAKTSYIKQCKELSNFDANTTNPPSRGITCSVFDLSLAAEFQNSMKQFASAFKSAMVSGTYQSYKAASTGVIRALGYPFKQQGQSRSFSDTHTPVDFGGFLNNLKPNLPILNDEINQVQDAMQQLVVDYEGNVANIDPFSGAYTGRFSFDIGEGKDYLNALPDYFTDIGYGIEAYKKNKDTDTFTPDGNLICPEGVVCAAFPNWLELESSDVSGLTIYRGWVDDGFFQVSKIETFLTEENSESDIEIDLPANEIFTYILCVNDNDCNAITVKYTNGLLMGEAVVNEVNSVLTFCPKDENEWTVCSVVGTSGDTWGREDSLYSEDTIKTITVKKTDGKTETAENTLMSVDNPAQVALKKDFSIPESDKKIVVSYYGVNQHPEEKEVCLGANCKNAGILIRK